MEAVGRGPQRHELAIPEQHNLRAALDWAGDADSELGLRLVVALENFWITHDPAEGMRRFEALLDPARAIDRTLEARARRDYASCAMMAGDLDVAEREYRASGDLFRAAGDELGVATITFRFGVVASWRGDTEQARELYEESRATFRRLGETVGELQALGNLGALEATQGNAERAVELIESSLRLAREIGWIWWETAQLANLAELALESGHIDEGERRARAALVLARETGDRELMVFSLAQLTWVAVDRGDAVRARLLWATIEAQEARHPLPRWKADRERYAAHVPATTNDVPVMTLEEAVAYASN